MEKEMELEARKLFEYFNKLINDFKRLNRKREDSHVSEQCSSELTLIIEKINKFRKEYSPFIKERKNSFGKFDIERYLEVKQNENKLDNEKNKQFNFLDPKQYSTYETQQEIPLNSPKIAVKEESEKTVMGNVDNIIYRRNNRVIDLIKKHREMRLLKHETMCELSNLSVDRREKVIKSCHEFMEEVIVNLLSIANTKERKIVKKKDLYFLFKLYGIDLDDANYSKRSKYFF